MPMRIGILSLQGNVQQHRQILLKIGAEPVTVKSAEHLSNLDGLILPGGESTTMANLLCADLPLRNAIVEFGTEQRRPILGTCAGLIILAKTVYGREGKMNNEQNVNALGLLDVVVQRNAYGTQTNSEFRAIRTSNGQQFCASFIRAPSIVHAGKNVQILAKFEGTEETVAIRQHNILGLCFHPENSDISYFHELLLRDAECVEKL